MALFGRARTKKREREREAVHRALLDLRQRGRQQGADAVVAESWQLMSHCFAELGRGDEEYAPLLVETARTSFGLHALCGQWFPATCSALNFCTAVAFVESRCTSLALPFPEDLLPGVQVMLDTSLDVAHRAGIPLAACIIAEALATMQLGARTRAREMSAVLGGEDALRRLQAIRRSQQETIARESREPAVSVDGVAALRSQADAMLLQDLTDVIDGSQRWPLHAGATVAPAVLAASLTGRSVVYVVPGAGAGTAVRLEATETGRTLCESIALPLLGLDAVRVQAKRVRDVLNSGERRPRLRDLAARSVFEAVAASVWRPVLDAWPDLEGGRVAIIPVGESALLPLFTTPVDGVPVCARTDLTVVPSGRALMFAGTWPRSTRTRRKTLVVADPWYHDGAGGVPIKMAVSEAREVAALHGVDPVILHDPDPGAGTGQAPQRAADPLPAAVPGGLVARIADADLIHLAGHGILDLEAPLNSTLLLGRPTPLSALLPRDLRRGATVVLSARHLAGLGTARSAEQADLPASVLAMGASSVIAALWPVPDVDKTKLLMTHLHEELQRNTPPSVAAGRAVARLAQERNTAHIWGPLTHFGA
ncbi:CHAT domain-containing protein [Streptomyces sp. NBC_01439]|uniref:CHAT domain-containing protein n=1 Tax=Streptomyces sp. NBC_01439 TaxID=2903867 RepID=UPI002E2A3187|nr:CHAT domain-containing protein [Streptomyces sp. NBC_01439]